jgi:hypothetical protein
MNFRRKRTKITDEEYEAIIDDITERLMDLTFVNSKKLVKKALPRKLVETSLDSCEHTFKIIRSFEFISGDLLQIIGRVRRLKLQLEG